MNSSACNKFIVLFVWKFIRLQRWKFVIIFILSLFWSLDATLWPYLIRLVVDTLSQFDSHREMAWPHLKMLLGAGLFLWVFVEGGFRLRAYMQAKAFPQLEADIRMEMFSHVQRHSPKYFNEHFAGSLANKINDMVTQVTLIFEQIIFLFLPALLTCILTVLFFFQINALFALILAAWIIIHFWICFIFTPKAAEYSNIHSEARSSLAGKVVDSLTNNFTVNLFYKFAYERQRIGRLQSEEQEKNTLARMYVAKMFLYLSLVFIAGGVALNSFMISSWLQGKISTGEVIQIFNTTWNLIMIIWFAAEFIPQLFQSLGIVKQAISIMRDPQDLGDLPFAKPLIVTKGEIVFENVSFCYDEKRLFQNKNISIHGGEKVGLVGFSGSGKSTFVNLILRLFPVEKGRILIDGQNIAEVSLESLRKYVALIPQDPSLFHRTLEENIKYGKVEASQKEIVEAATLAHCDTFIRKTGKGYHSLVGERGTKLSGGERQRIAIARALLAGAPILILDEATSALDSVTENYIQESLAKIMDNRTTIVIAHRLSTLAKMDRILVFDKGSIIEQGTHDQLLTYGGHYALLWNMQAGGFLPEDPNIE